MATTLSIRAGANRTPLILPICYVGFVSLGLPDTLIGVAWPSVRETFRLEQSAVSWIFFGGGCSYFLSSFFAGRLLRVFNVGVLLAISSGLVALSGFNFSFATNWPWFAAGALLHGLGSGAIDSGLNHYVATHFSARHMNWLHACYSFGAMLGPIIMTASIARPNGWRLGYLIVAITLSALAILFLATKRHWHDSTAAASEHNGSETHPNPADTLTEALHEPPIFPSDAGANAPSEAPVTGWTALRHRTVQVHVLLFFIYTGIEVAIGQWSFTVLTESRSIHVETAGGWVTIYWASILAGRVIFGFIVDRISIDRLIRLSLLVALAGTALFAWNPFAGSAPIALALCGLGLAVIFPCLMTRTPQRLGKELAAHAIGFQVGAAMLGAAALPSACGWIAQYAGLGSVAPGILLFAGSLFLLHEILLLQARSIPREKPAS